MIWDQSIFIYINSFFNPVVSASSRCKDVYNGNWDGSKCKAVLHLTEVCIRVKINENDKKLELDLPPYIYFIFRTHVKTHKDEDLGGCRYNFGTYSPIFYDASARYKKTLRIIVRYTDDPYIYCDDITEGCTGISLSENDKCFGMTFGTETTVGASFVTAGLVLLSVIVVLTLYCFHKCGVRKGVRIFI